jgi:hypothetical protein
VSPPSFRSRSTWVPLLLVAALMLRALVPAGWMPVSTSQGIAMTLCTGAGPVTLKTDGPAPATPDDHGDNCPFAATATGLPAPDVPVHAGLPLLFASITALPVTAALRFGEGLGSAPQPATGPPAAS